MPWSHLSSIPGHPMDADFDCSGLQVPAKFAVVGDFDGDGVMEIAIALDATRSAGNDFWVMKFMQSSFSWEHMSPVPGHPAQADFDCSPSKFPAKFAVTGDFDKDGQMEIAIAIDSGNSAGNDFWVMKYDKITRTWFHLSPIPGHPLDADFDCSGTNFPAKFAVVGDFDNDKQSEIAIAPDAGSSAGNDFWVMKYDPNKGIWFHLSPIPGHPFDADFDCSAVKSPAKFAVTGDFDGDNQIEIAIAPDAAGSAGNDFWVMKFDIPSGSWIHLKPIFGHPMNADFDCSSMRFPAKFAVTGDFDGDGQSEIAIGIDTGTLASSNFWVMKFDLNSGRWVHFSPIRNHPFDADFECNRFLSMSANYAVTGRFSTERNLLTNKFKDQIVIAPHIGGTAGNDFWAMEFDNASRRWVHMSPIQGHPMGADFDCSGLNIPAKFAVAGRFESDERDKIAIAPDALRSAGNDFWTMGFFPTSPDFPTTFTGTATVNILPAAITILGMPFPLGVPFATAVSLILKLDRFRRAVEIVTFGVMPITNLMAGTTTTITKVGGGRGSFDKPNGILNMPVSLRIITMHSMGMDISDIDFDLTTQLTQTTPRGMSAGGMRLNAITGTITIAGASTFKSGMLDTFDCTLIIPGTLSQIP